jgi:acyl carrier protein phosphodiesterase
MNWLAHIQLSGDSAATQIGNLIPDLVRASELGGISEQFSAGIKLHRMIDSYTDTHPVFRSSTARIDGPLRRYASILIDLFYDHFLACEWSAYSAIPLAKVVGDFHESIDSFHTVLPEPVYDRLVQIREEGYLLSYSTEDGIAEALLRVSSRLRRPVNLAAGVVHLRAHYELFAADFRDFYPQLIRHIRL